MKRLLILTSALEAATGIALLATPALVAWLLLDGDLRGEGIVIARLAGVALFSLGVACWPGSAGGHGKQLRGMLAYNVLVTCLLAFAGVAGETIGWLLWPVVALHGGLSIGLAIGWSRQRSGSRVPSTDTYSPS